MTGELAARGDFATYVGKFCFDFTRELEETAGDLVLDTSRMNWQKVSPEAKVYFLLFDDERQHWKRAKKKWDTSTCNQKKEAASYVVEIDNLHTDERQFSYDVHIREHLRPRFWYFAFVGCGVDVPLQLRYKLHTTNDRWGWQREFSLDHMGLFGVHVAFMALFLAAAGATAVASRRSSGRDAVLRDHPYVKLLLLSYAASLASAAFFLIHYGLFVHDGFGSKRIRFLGVLASIVANCTIFLIAMLASVSWAITTPTLPNRRGFLGLVAIVGGVNALSELHAEITLDESTRLYAYQSLPGTMSLVVKVFMFCWFAFQIKATYEQECEPKLKLFYKYLGFSLSCWSANVPVMVVLAFLISPWYRYKVVVSVEVAARFAGSAILSWLLCGPLSPINAHNTFLDRGDALVSASFGELTEQKPGF